jgi:crotonobetainyl-CoA:carnitine CoA-transferase CaiB-like acyl-CoA transferase
MAPVRTIAEVVESEQLAARDYITPLDAADGLSVRYPGPFARFSAAPIRYRRRAPRLDEHGSEIRAERRMPHAAAANGAPGRPGPQPSAARSPLEGVKVLDFMWALAGPLATRTLADHGATVIRIESSSRLDVCRTILPFLGGRIGAETASLFHSANVGKRMLTLDPCKPEGRQTALDLVRWADVVCESFTPRTMKKLGLDYETLRREKPDLIMLSTCLMGQTGPLAGFAGYGNLAAAMTGFQELAGWPDRPPAGPFGAYTDYIAPRYNAAALLAALEHRRLTGEGQHIDLAQAEAALHFLAPAILDYTVNGEVTTRAGNRDRELAPHGVYPCAGEDRWVAIAARDDRDWHALCEVLGAPALASDARYATAAARRAQQGELDALLAGLTAKLAMEEVERRLHAAGVPASGVYNSPEAASDPQLAHHGHFVTVAHPTAGQAVVEAARFRLSRTPAHVTGPAPTFGDSTQWVLEAVLGYDDERIAELAIAGALE